MNFAALAKSVICANGDWSEFAALAKFGPVPFCPAVETAGGVDVDLNLNPAATRHNNLNRVSNKKPRLNHARNRLNIPLQRLRKSTIGKLHVENKIPALE